ncbi:MarR family winged helix-turn-helix transcriptional regulator [Streptomyces caatingaensis]|uniref:MarR family transcriptional regulator n=1 Tax=Streptomyces caatingaensis TaxID=1678637 RepID=A0A0K9XGG3_9ACTN|nr:MarR family winged helix-turn-helix transcriptional regulator [Streptomyces caatingaensis]KNB52480.1 MarR family transcriptional regulator [Streptomyces caatingaensis]
MTGAEYQCPNEATTTTDSGTCGEISHAIARVSKLHRITAGQLLRRLGLYPGQELLMMALWEHGPQRQSELIKLMGGLDPSTVTRMVQRLEQAGLVGRQPDPADRRAVMVKTTEQGEALRGEVAEVWQELENATLAGLGDHDRAELSRLLGLLETNLHGACRPC